MKLLKIGLASLTMSLGLVLGSASLQGATLIEFALGYVSASQAEKDMMYISDTLAQADDQLAAALLDPAVSGALTEAQITTLTAEALQLNVLIDGVVPPTLGLMKNVNLHFPMFSGVFNNVVDPAGPILLHTDNLLSAFLIVSAVYSRVQGRIVAIENELVDAGLTLVDVFPNFDKSSLFIPLP